MKISSEGVVDGKILDKYGKFAEGKDKTDGIPTRSPPISWSELPEGTESLAIVMIDHDTVPLVGFAWTHWLAANISPKLNGLPENASREMRDFVQGENSLGREDVSDDLARHYAGPQPPDKDHAYEITVYALDSALKLRPGFKLEELMKAMWGHNLDSAVLRATYRAN